MILATPSFATAQGQLQVTVRNFNVGGGSLMIGLFNNEHDFLKKAIRGKTVKLTADIVTVVFEDLEPGDYAVSVIHDRNNNGKLDTNRLGIPREGFAFGNNAMGMFGPPTFVKAKVSIRDNAVKQILNIKNF